MNARKMSEAKNSVAPDIKVLMGRELGAYTLGPSEVRAVQGGGEHNNEQLLGLIAVERRLDVPTDIQEWARISQCGPPTLVMSAQH
jgi:hypothetical protein